METPKWKPLEEEREVMEVVWMQVKGAARNEKRKPMRKTSTSERCLKKWLTVITHDTLPFMINN